MEVNPDPKAVIAYYDREVARLNQTLAAQTGVISTLAQKVRQLEAQLAKPAEE